MSLLGALVAAMLAACGGSDEGQVADTGATPDSDAATVLDIDVSAFDSDTGTSTSADTAQDSDTGGGDGQSADGEDAGDTSIEPGTFGAPCNENKDCISSWCVTSDEGPVCTRQCEEDCPGGWSCLGIAGEIDVTFLCVPRQDRLCQPCLLDRQCNNGYCLSFADGQRCSASCDEDDDCPSGYHCEMRTSESVEDARSMQCVPNNDTCACLPGNEGLQEPCNVQTDAGTCWGLRTCLGGDGWSACDAPTPAAETCDGVDNNCNLFTDENVTGNGASCTVENELGTCSGLQVCRGAAGFECVAPTPAAETCNFQDDDCDGDVDEGYADPVSGLYVDDHNCGVCGNDCEGFFPNAISGCATTDGQARCVVEECAQGFYQAGPTTCLPVLDANCLPCTEDTNCVVPGNACVALDGGNFCAQDCAPGNLNGLRDGSCGEGFECTSFGDGRSLCMPKTSSCACLDSADAGKSRPCTQANAFGTCAGTQSCDPTGAGFSACTARVPGAEICNGEDDDCDGVFDEGVAEPSEPCERTNAFGTCRGAWTCDGAAGWLCTANVPAAETCNYEDDNCDGQVDEGFVDASSGQYLTNDSCGICGRDCDGVILFSTVTECRLQNEIATCVAIECEPDFYIPPDTNRVCIPTSGAASCSPCADDAQCAELAGGACTTIDGGRFCTAACAVPADCDEGYDCIGGRCMPTTLSCTCRPGLEGSLRPCVDQNAFGTCTGFETCDPTATPGWSGCSARTPAAEECNGQDDNCNGRADENLTHTPSGCTAENAAGTCIGTYRCEGSDGWQCPVSTPATESCNFQDDDCDGQIDEDFRGVGGKYTDDENCGNCGNSCVDLLPNASAQCVATGAGQPRCEVASCDPGYYQVGPLTCLPAQDTTCIPCVSDENCPTPGDKCIELDGGHFCGRDCSAGNVHGLAAGQCDEGFDCFDFGAGVEQCVPFSGSCSCLDGDRNEIRTCQVENASGTCFGTEVCAPENGWGGCTAATPAGETCNGVDDNCNGRVDESVTPPSAPCEVQNAAGKCTATWVCGATDGWVCNAKTPTDDVCNGLDDDCDGGIDEDFRATSGIYDDLTNCGACGISCVGAIPNATAQCVVRGVAARCEVQSCAPGFYRASDLTCLPASDNTCFACSSDASCPTPGDKCLPLDGGSFCGRDCSAGNNHGTAAGVCPSGFVCQDVAGGAKQCVPQSGSCSCLGADAGETRACRISNDAGTCFGDETCNPATGWIGCDAETPVSEACDGEDNDCDGVTDEGVTHAPPTCSSTVTGVGTCTGTFICGGLSGWQCPVATPIAEKCDFLDNDCDGQTDEDFRANGQYVNDRNCGSCGISCEGAIPNATAECAVGPNGQPRCEVATCNVGYFEAGPLSCASATSNLCSPCTTDAECPTPGDKCLTGTGGARYCGQDCSAGNLHGTNAGVCPSGYSCQAEPGAHNQCKPTSGTCDCLPANSGATRTCQVSNGSGTCFGNETCNPGSGWVGCTAKVPAAEQCNGLDDNCNAQIDELVTHAPTTCSNTVAGVGTCSATYVCQGASGWQCPVATPQTETCNALDDDCDASVDETFKNAQGLYTNLNHCGACGVSCVGAIPNATATCATNNGQPRCEVASCDAGYYQAGPLTCLQSTDNSCAPCSTDANCRTPGDKCLTLDGGKFCGRDCSASNVHGTAAGVCPTGFSCSDLGAGVRQCVPQSGSCSCLTGDSGETRSCLATNDSGTCFGNETCNPASGWLGCSARTPAVEDCDGVDDDCDTVVDDVSGRGSACTTQNGFGTCSGVRDCVGGQSALQCTAATPAAETCNSRDDDCDSQTDEGFGINQSCSNGVGACQRFGFTVCNGAGSGVTCNAVAGTASTEVCDNIDNDCDTGQPGGGIDENAAWANKGTPCSDGLGVCQVTGVYVCSANGQSTVCSQTKLTPAVGTEVGKCNNLDDDCDGSIDEDFGTKGQVCSTGVGVCRSFGNFRCNTGGTGVECDAVAGTGGNESCDLLDNDCDGSTDEDFKNAAGSKYDKTTTCGNCFTNCTAIFAGKANAFGTCDSAPATPTCAMSCNTGFFNLNNVPDDGCEFKLETNAIYVGNASTGAVDDATCGLGPVGTGTNFHPCRSIAQGLARASSAGKTQVIVADGLYTEQVTLRNGINLLGGYRADTWERHLDSTNTTIRGPVSTTGHAKTIIATDITAAVVEGFIIYGGSSFAPSGNSYLFYVNNPRSGLVIRKNFLFGGNGGPGTDGTPGSAGADGGDGENGERAIPLTTLTSALCASNTDTPGNVPACYTTAGSTATSNTACGAGGSNTCGGSSVGGGPGAGARCPKGTTQEPSGSTGSSVTGGGTAGGGGAGGGDWTRGSCQTSWTGNLNAAAENGKNGGRGTNAAAGSGASVAIGGVTTAEWVGSGGASGATGTAGGGGGGGGAGGGADQEGGTVCQQNQQGDTLGSSGGGGGAGGCAGTFGAGGAGGGGSFVVFIANVSIASNLPVLTANTVTRGIGGDGGNGGAAGKGGLGGDGGAPGVLAGLSSSIIGPGGRGGQGGDGGHGGGGGGGAGGVSYGVYLSIVATPTYKTDNTFVVSGDGGAGGVGGPSFGFAGTDGTDGASADANF